MKCTSLYTKTMIMRKISYIICKKYKCRHGEILVNATGLSPVEKSCGFESHWRHNRPHGQTGKVAKCLYDERVDMRALETRAERRVGANPTTGT